LQDGTTKTVGNAGESPCAFSGPSYLQLRVSGGKEAKKPRRETKDSDLSKSTTPAWSMTVKRGAAGRSREVQGVCALGFFYQFFCKNHYSLEKRRRGERGWDG